MSKRIFIIKIETVSPYLGDDPEYYIQKLIEDFSYKNTGDDINPVSVKVMEI